MGATESGATDGAVKNIQSQSAAKSGLSGSVGISGANAPDDVWKVSSALTNNGLMEAPQSHADNALFTSITKAQENMDSTLKRDGLVNPGGPTESTYTRYVGQGFVKAPSSTVTPAQAGAQSTGTLDAGLRQHDGFSNPLAHRKPAEPGTGGLYAPGTAKDVLRRDHAKQQAADQQARLQRQQERRQEREQADAAKRAMAAHQTPGLNIGLSTSVKPETVKKAVEGLGALANKVVPALPGEAASALTGEGGATATSNAAKRPALSDEAYASNRRTADALGKYKGVGDLPRFTTDAINTHGEKAVHAVADLIGQVHGRSPEQAQELFDKTVQGIAPENRAFLQQALDGQIADQNKVVTSLADDAGTLSGWQMGETPIGGAGDDTLGAQSEADNPWDIERRKVGYDGNDTEVGQAPQSVPVPGYRSDVFKSPKGQKDWSTWQTDVGKLPNASESEQRAYAEIFAAEGGMATDPRGSAASGITQTTLDELVANGKLPAALKGHSPSSLSSEQRATVYRAYTDHALSLAGGHTALAKLDTQSASALGDTLFRHGRKGGGEIVQKAVNTVTPGAVKVNGPVGPETFGAYQKLAADPATRKRLMDALADARKVAVKGEATAQAEAARFDHFRDGSAF